MKPGLNVMFVGLFQFSKYHGSLPYGLTDFCVMTANQCKSLPHEHLPNPTPDRPRRHRRQLHEVRTAARRDFSGLVENRQRHEHHARTVTRAVDDGAGCLVGERVFAVGRGVKADEVPEMWTRWCFPSQYERL